MKIFDDINSTVQSELNRDTNDFNKYENVANILDTAKVHDIRKESVRLSRACKY